ncbi:MAG: pyridoxal phosphate-dependent aminotransferase [Deltaproteobacteria bacterium]|nr:pyridoxal phosphate-dependent aminotransferase [Deltaproteobacteria bacterium]
MPRRPRFSANVNAMPGAVYSPFADQAAAAGRRVHPLHVGDTWMEPFEGGRMEDLRVEEHPGMHRYCNTQGIAPLVDALVEKVRARNGFACERESLLVSAGATGGLACALGAILEPGDEVLILAPFWPLIRGIVQLFGGVPVEVPFYDRVSDVEGALEAVAERMSPRSVALYVSTPSNPTGRVLPESWLAALAELACREDLWLLSDEVYEELVYRGEHCSMARFAPERTLSAFSFSKAYGMAGNRVGYVVGPEALLEQARKVATHTFYAAPTAGQLAALAALSGGASWIERARALYREAGDASAKLLGIDPPEGSTFFFLDASRKLDERGMAGFLADCFEDGVLVAPGASCGEAYADWVRVCYTAAPPEQISDAMSLLARRLG